MKPFFPPRFLLSIKTFKKKRVVEPAIKRLNSSLSLTGGLGLRLLLSLLSPSPTPTSVPPPNSWLLLGLSARGEGLEPGS